MPLTRELEIKAKDDIYNSINLLIDRYLKEGVQINDLKRYFKPKKIFDTLLKDIHYAGRNYFNEDEGLEYINYVKKILNRIILDRLSEEDTKKIMEKKIIKYNEFLNESINLNNINIDELYKDVNYSDEDMDIISSYFNTRKDYIKSKNPKYNTYTVTDFKLDVLNNNRTSFDVLILEEYQINTMIDNVVNNLTVGIYSVIPQDIEYNGIKIKLHSVIDKNGIKESIKSLVTEQDIIELISNLTKYVYDNKYGNYHIWKKIK